MTDDLWLEPLDRPDLLGDCLARVATTDPDRPFAVFVDDGRELSYGELDRAASRFANGLRERGVEPGAFVAIMLRNVPEMLVAQYGAFMAGVVAANINADFRGPALARMLDVTGASHLVTSVEFNDVLQPVLGKIGLRPTVVVVDGDATGEALAWEEFLSWDEARPDVALHPTETAAVLFTSGTTGVSKGCLLSHRFAITSAATVVRALQMSQDDCIYTPYPLHHYAATFNDVLPAMLVGGRVAIRRRFSVSSFWPDIRQHGGTIFEFIGSTAKLLADAPSQPDEADNPARVFWGGPLPADERAFCERFGLHLTGSFGSTDMNNVTYRRTFSGEPEGSVGVPVPLFDLRVADEYDDPVAPGEMGELLVRPREAGLLSSGYLGMPEATAEVWRNLWYHTGDYVRFDEGGHMWYLGRKTESLRRSGENVSTHEVEEGLHLHPRVVEAAVVGIPSPLGEQLVKAFVVLREGPLLSGEDLCADCAEHMAKFMIPDVIEFIDEMPRTPTGKVAKAELEAASRS